MNKRTINITLTFDISSLPISMITPKEVVWEMVKKDMVGLYFDDEGFLGSEVEVIDE